MAELVPSSTSTTQPATGEETPEKHRRKHKVTGSSACEFFTILPLCRRERRRRRRSQRRRVHCRKSKGKEVEGNLLVGDLISLFVILVARLMLR